ncbi:MAG: tyrosine-type recombinase/integrase, partial [Devosia sp.]|uniref:tyrosine-type recombinase/integrase n=1 Tax=Devosia sp. TaxID=1871048 RepID=UPI001ACBA139
KMPASDNAQQCHVDHSTAPAQTTRGKGHTWVKSRWKNPSLLGQFSVAINTHSLRRSKVAQLYRKTGNLRAVQLLLGHAKIETTVRYLGVEVDDALRLAEQIEL